MKLTEHKRLVLDGACGTTLQDMALPATAWGHCEGCTEYLNISAASVIREMHAAFLEAGAMVIETNTFGANRLVLGEYGLEARTAEINRLAVEHAKRAAGSTPNRYVAGSIGPTTKLPSLGHVTVDDLADVYDEQATALLEAGVDLLLVETCQDLLQVKTAVIQLHETMERLDKAVPLMVSLTMERTGTMLVGSDIAAAAVALEPFDLFSLGLNCATGPADMTSNLRYLSEQWPGRVSCVPNQGLPEVVDGRTVYSLTPDAYAEQMAQFVKTLGISIVGGCCGTTPAHISALVGALDALGGSTP